MTDATGENSGNCKNGKSDEGGKSGKLQPKLRFKGFTDAWEQRALGELIPHKRVTVNPVSGTYYRLWSIPSYDAGNPELVDGNQIKSTKQIVQNNDVLLGKINPRINRVWVVAIQPLDLAINIASTEWIIFRSTTNNSFDPYFILSFLSAPNTRTRLMSEVTGATGSQKRFQPASIAQHPYYTSSLPEQECIGSLFRCLDSLIAAAERKARLLRKKKHAYLNHIFTQHLRFTGHTTPWQTKKLGNIADIVGGGTPSTIRPEYWDGGIQWFTPAEITKAQAYVSNSTKTITELGLSKSSARLLPGNRTILFTSRASIGETALLTVDATTNQGFQSIVLKDGINRYFIYCMVSNLRRYAQRMASGSTFLEISNHQLAKAPVYIPDSSEQAEIARFFQTLDSLIAAAERKVNLLKKKKQAYLQKMFI
ncbi:restriction endonuclease subunit S [Scardovia wiggsiae]|uniref:restriction endonuclease subunit S n=1 Tax=Scardovia wiggsiae TaxID=230143 RepID=UPI00374E3AED